MDELDKLKLDDYFKKNLNINLEQLIGHFAVLKQDVMMNMNVHPEHHYEFRYPIKVNKGITIKITGPIPMPRQPLGYSNSLYIEIVNPQIQTGELFVVMEELVKAIK